MNSEKSAEEQDQICEYDMDSEDEKWLLQYNTKRKQRRQKSLSEDNLEIMLDRLEKASFYNVSLFRNIFDLYFVSLLGKQPCYV